MKKTLGILAAACLLSSFAGAISVDSTTTVVRAIGYKTNDKQPVPMVFNEAEVKFSATSGKIAEVLNGTTAVVQLSSVDTDRNPLRDKNIRTLLFGGFKTTDAKAVINSTLGDESKGTLKVSLTLNGASKDIDMAYEVRADKLIARGTIDIAKDFGTAEAFEKFKNDKIIQGLHGKNTWSEVEVGFEVKLKK